MRLYFALFLGLFLTGCATTHPPLTQSDIRQINECKEQTFSESYSTVFAATKSMLESFGYKLVAADKNSGIITTYERAPNQVIIDSVTAHITKANEMTLVNLSYLYKPPMKGLTVDDRQLVTVYNSMFDRLKQKIKLAGHEYNASYNVTWKALAQTFVEKSIPIKTLDKESGIIVSDTVVFEDHLSFSSDFLDADQEIQRISKRPSVFFAVWKAGRYTISASLKSESDDITAVAIDTKIEAFNNIDGWRKCESKGVLENEIYSILDSRLK